MASLRIRAGLPHSNRMQPPANPESGSIASAEQDRLEFTQARQRHWDSVALGGGDRGALRRHYQRRLREVFRLIVPEGVRVLELGSGTGELLASLKPSYGVGVDLSPAMAAEASRRHPGLTFLAADAHQVRLEGPFDYVLCSDLLNDVWDVQALLDNVAFHCGPGTRLVVNYYSRMWEIPRRLAELTGLARPHLPQNWLTTEDIGSFCALAGLEVLRHWTEVLCPAPLPGFQALCNRFLVRLPVLRSLALTNFLVARPAPRPRTGPEPVVSVVVPARNEEGNIETIFRTVPEMGAGTELIFVEGHSRDRTLEAIRQAIGRHPERRAAVYVQAGKGKGDAVRLGFEKSAGGFLMIYDADCTVPPESLPRFYEAWRSGQGELINGVRLVYPMQERAMRFLNLLGNKAFSLAFSWLLGQSVKDTLCGTKALGRDHYQLLSRNRAYFGEFDPFGDFDLLFGAAKLNLKIVGIPVRYRERTYGETNIRRWRHGWLLLRMMLVALRRLKLV